MIKPLVCMYFRYHMHDYQCYKFMFGIREATRDGNQNEWSIFPALAKTKSISTHKDTIHSQQPDCDSTMIKLVPLT